MTRVNESNDSSIHYLQHGLGPAEEYLDEEEEASVRSAAAADHRSVMPELSCLLDRGAYLYDVRSGWGEEVPKKQTKGTMLCEFCT